MINFKDVYVNEKDWNITGRLIRAFPTGSEANTNLIARIKVGEKVEGSNGSTYSKGLDYFKVHDNPSIEDIFKGVYGEKPNAIRLMFLSSGINACREYLELRDGKGKLAAETDNRFIRVVRKDPNNKDKLALLPLTAEEIEKRGGIEEVKQKLVEHFNSSKGWNHKLRLTFCLYDLMEGMGQFFFETSGAYSSIPNILQTFDAVKEILGRVDRIPFTLTVRKASGALSGSAKSYPVVSLYCDLSEKQLLWLKEKVKNENFPYENQGVLTADKIRDIYKQMKNKAQKEQKEKV